jgi:hypothetical protein
MGPECEGYPVDVSEVPLIPNPRNAKQRKEAKVRQAFGSPFFMHQPIA